MASAPDDAWQRQMIRTVDSNYSWDTSAAVSNTTTYSLSIAAFPATAYSGFEAMMYLIPVAGMPSGPDDPSVDWDSSHVVYFTNIYATDDLTKQLGPTWLSLPTTATGWVLVGGNKRLAVIDQSALNTAFGSVPTGCFFGLWHVGQ